MGRRSFKLPPHDGERAKLMLMALEAGMGKVDKKGG